MDITPIDLSRPLPPRWNESKWNGWFRNGINLGYRAYGVNAYWIDLEICSSARMLDIIMQVARKSWATDKCLAGLVHALDDIFQPQGRLCSCGIDKRLSLEQARRLALRPAPEEHYKKGEEC